MEKTAKNPQERRFGLTKLILKENAIITVLDLSNNKLTNVENIHFPMNLIELNLSKNELKCVPTRVLTLKNIKLLDLSSNNIRYFDETPAFCHSIEKLNLSKNDLYGPPYWVWCNYPRNLRELDISCNANIRRSLSEDYFSELLQYKTLLSVINMNSCGLNSHYELLGTFTNAKTLDLSSGSVIQANCFSNVPCKGLDKCCDIERLKLSYTYLSLINSNIDMYKNLIEIDLAENSISSLPKEFCNLNNLEICILSYNILMYLPDDFIKLKRLSILCLDSNKLCMLPQNMNELQNLTKLDVYDNYLYEVPECSGSLKELDLGQNYFDEPDDDDYIIKRSRLRTGIEDRIIGRKFEVERSESPHSTRSIDEELANIDYSNNMEEACDATNQPSSSPEDWDSDDYWVPHMPPSISVPQSPWLSFVKRKMAEGNFCPMDAHVVSVSEKVRYEKLCNPQPFHEVIGQFDDCSSDDS